MRHVDSIFTHKFAGKVSMLNYVLNCDFSLYCILCRLLDPPGESFVPYLATRDINVVDAYYCCWCLLPDLQWRHNDGVSNHRRLHCLLSCWFRHRSEENIGDRWIPRTKCFHLMTSPCCLRSKRQRNSYTNSRCPSSLQRNDVVNVLKHIDG